MEGPPTKKAKRPDEISTVAELLAHLDAGGSVNCRGDLDISLLVHCLNRSDETERFRMAAILIASGADVMQTWSGWKIPLVILCQYTNPILLGMIIGVNREVLRQRDGNGRTVLHTLIDVGPDDDETPFDRFVLFVDHGADINAVTYGNWTPLMSAGRDRNVEITRFLLTRGARRDVATYATTEDPSTTALEIAQKRGFDDIVALFAEIPENI